MSPQNRVANLNKATPLPLEVSIACALNDADKALAVLFTMLQKAAPAGAEVADEVRANVRRAQKDFGVLVRELIRRRTKHHSGCAVYDVTRPELGECNCGAES